MTDSAESFAQQTAAMAEEVELIQAFVEALEEEGQSDLAEEAVRRLKPLLGPPDAWPEPPHGC